MSGFRTHENKWCFLRYTKFNQVWTFFKITCLGTHIYVRITYAGCLRILPILQDASTDASTKALESHGKSFVNYYDFTYTNYNFSDMD